MEGNRRLIVQRRTAQRERDSPGADVTPWLPSATLWARVEQPRGRQYYAAPLVDGRVVTTFRTRYRADAVRITDRLVWEGAEYDVHAVLDEHGAHRWLLIHASARPAQ